MSGLFNKMSRRFGTGVAQQARFAQLTKKIRGSKKTRWTGYAPTNVGPPATSHPDYDELGSSGYGPTNTRGPLVTALRMKAPGGMTATGAHAQGTGDSDDGITRTGWAPTDSSQRDG